MDDEIHINEVLLYLSLKYKGDWESIFHAVRVKEKYDHAKLEELRKDMKCKYVTLLDKEYPSCLKLTYRPPFVIYYYGNLDLLKTNTIGVIGSRDNSGYGKENCTKIVSELSKELTIVSGLARGIDSIAHQAAINASGKTIAVLGSGIDNCYPKENLSIYNNIKENHLLLSEYPGDVAPDAEHFPMRNRIIAGISNSLFVVECKKRSGTAITIGYTLEAGKDVFCLPHNVDGVNFCNSLIKEGAYLVESAKDILDFLK